ncbi:MAG TPA: hypothetical protein VF595_18155 [Tepidisphaeraceae bacterium]|jgi:hypothetical protein
MSFRLITGSACLTASIFLTPARGEFVTEHSGSFAERPFYRAIALQGATFEGGADNAFAIPNGLDYFSNTGPKPQALVSGTIEQNGATMTANASAIYNGFFSSKNSATMTVTNASADDGYYVVAGQGTRTTVQFFTPAAAAARSVFRWRVTGSESAPFGVATSRLDFLAGQHEDKDWNYLFEPESQALSVYGPGEFTYNLATPLNTPIDLFFWSAAYAELDRGVAPAGSNLTLTANYGSTYELIDIELFDANENLLTEWTMMDQATGETVFNAAGPVPEPAALSALMLTGLALSRRRARA